METEPFTAIIDHKEITVYQNAYTGLFYTILSDGSHTPVDYALVRPRTTSRQRLKYWRNRCGYTQAELARLAYVSSPTVIATWENGLRYPRKEYRRLLNNILGGDVFLD